MLRSLALGMTEHSDGCRGKEKAASQELFPELMWLGKVGGKGYLKKNPDFRIDNSVRCI